MTWLAVKTFILSPLGLGILGAISAVVLLTGVHHAGVNSGVAREKAAEAQRVAKAQREIVIREVKAQGLTDRIKTDLGKERVRIETVTRTITREIPVYVTPAADARCDVPLGFVRLHDAAATATAPPRAPGGPLDPASGVKLSAVADTVVRNYGVAYGWRAEAQAWRDWYAVQKAAWDKP